MSSGVRDKRGLHILYTPFSLLITSDSSEKLKAEETNLPCVIHEVSGKPAADGICFYFWECKVTQSSFQHKKCYFCTR